MKTMAPLVNICACTALIAVVFAGCRKKSQVQTTAPPMAMGGGPADLTSSIDAIADAECQREAACGNVGPDKRFMDRITCVAEMRRDAKSTVHERNCANGVEQARLNACLSAARNETCANPFNTLTTYVPCKSETLCSR